MVEVQLDGIAKRYSSISGKQVQVERTIPEDGGFQRGAADCCTWPAVCSLGVFLRYISVLDVRCWSVTSSSRYIST